MLNGYALGLLEAFSISSYYSRHVFDKS